MEIPRRPRVWHEVTCDAKTAGDLARALGTSDRLAQLLVQRGLDTPQAAQIYLDDTHGKLHSPFALGGLEQAVDCILGAVARKQGVAIFGDYDVDGLTGSTILYWVVRRLGGACDVVIPHRNNEGYGLTVEHLARMARAGAKVIVTVDNGTSSVAEIAAAREMGLDVVVVDHHTLPERLPPATALINPLRPDCPYPFKGLASVGLAYKLGEALLARSGLAGGEELAQRFRGAVIDLVAVGTVADMAPLTGENRTLVRRGLEKLGRTDHLGLRSILAMESAPRPVTSEFVAFKIAPRLNAAGRIADPQQALSLLLSREPTEAASLARNLTALNARRLRMVDDLWRQACERAAEWIDQPIPVVTLPTPYKGLMGLLASRVKEALYRPAIALASDGEHATGSARSVEGFNITRALAAVSKHLTRYGGHAQAAGMTVRVDALNAFASALAQFAAPLLDERMLTPRLSIAARVAPGDVLEMAHEITCLEPCGVDNPRPLFLIAGLPVRDVVRMGASGRHARLTSPALPREVDVLAFNLGEHAWTLARTAARMDVVASIARESGPSGERVMLKVEDLRETAIVGAADGMAGAGAGAALAPSADPAGR